MRHISMTILVACGFMFLGTACGEKKDTGKDVAIQFLQRDVENEKKKNAAYVAFYSCKDAAKTDAAKAACPPPTW